MRILILGGTEFLGRHIVEAALVKGHEVTLFNRGKTNPSLFPDVERLQGDRDGNLDALRHKQWDAVIDPSGYVPRVVRHSAELLQDATGFYAFISSISVYADFSQVGMDENAQVGVLQDEMNEDVNQFYGPLKALCEQEVQSVFKNSALVIRPGLIVGPNDPSDRFTYWVRRFSQGGTVLVPGSKDRQIQFIDVRDLSEWIIRMVENQVSGVFNATGPDYHLTMGEFVSKLEEVIPNAGTGEWVSEAFLLPKGIQEFMELPLWISEKTQWPGFLSANVERAIQNGLIFRSLKETILDTLHWDLLRSRGSSVLKAGMSPEREKELLQDWENWDKN